MELAEALRVLDYTAASPAENLALDEALLEWAEGGGGGPVLRFYEEPAYCVVVGYGNRVAEEVREEACREDGVPVLRRISGGGTVVLGPGCLAYALVLPVDAGLGTESVTGTNRGVMERQARILGDLTGKAVEVEGHTDLAIGGLKFSGNAQRRRSRALLFHGTLLLGFELERLERWLRMPSAQPAYRGGRRHGEFVRNLGVDARAVKAAMCAGWGARAGEYGRGWEANWRRLMGERYGCAEWHSRR